MFWMAAAGVVGSTRMSGVGSLLGVWGGFREEAVREAGASSGTRSCEYKAV